MTNRLFGCEQIVDDRMLQSDPDKVEGYTLRYAAELLAREMIKEGAIVNRWQEKTDDDKNRHVTRVRAYLSVDLDVAHEVTDIEKERDHWKNAFMAMLAMNGSHVILPASYLDRWKDFEVEDRGYWNGADHEHAFYLRQKGHIKRLDSREGLDQLTGAKT